MKLFLIIATMLGLSIVHANDKTVSREVDNSPNANGILRTPSSAGTTTKEGASFGPDPVLKDRTAIDESSQKSNPQETDEKSINRKF